MGNRLTKRFFFVNYSSIIKASLERPSINDKIFCAGGGLRAFFGQECRSAVIGLDDKKN